MSSSNGHVPPSRQLTPPCQVLNTKRTAGVKRRNGLDQAECRQSCQSIRTRGHGEGECQGRREIFQGSRVGFLYSILLFEMTEHGLANLLMHSSYQTRLTNLHQQNRKASTRAPSCTFAYLRIPACDLADVTFPGNVHPPPTRDRTSRGAHQACVESRRQNLVKTIQRSASIIGKLGGRIVTGRYMATFLVRS